jgi:GGDEF domain-containing protein
LISIKRFLNRNGDEAVASQMVTLLLEKIGSQAVRGERSEYEAFAKSIEEIRSSVADVSNADTLLVKVGSAMQAMSDYNQRVSRFIRRQSTGLQTIVSMLADTVKKVSGENTQFGRNFQEVSDGLERASAMEDLTDLKSRLRDCLRGFREETLQRKAEMEEALAALQEQVERGRDLGGPPDCDPATGLPKQDAAEAAMLKNLKAGSRSYMVTVAVNHMQSINARFGYRVGDQVLRICRDSVEKQLLPGDQMFRWTGPAMVLLLERTETLDIVRGLVKRILDSKLEQSFEIGTRSVMIPISMSWSAFKLVSPVSIAIRQIQTFIASQSPRDFA